MFATNVNPEQRISFARNPLFLDQLCINSSQIFTQEYVQPIVNNQTFKLEVVCSLEARHI